MGAGTSCHGEAQVNWASASDFWSMGGYGFYVWGSYATVVAVIATEIVLLRARRRRAVSDVARTSLEASKIHTGTQ